MTSSTWSTMIENYLTFREVSQGRSQQTSVKYRLYLTRLLKFCEQADITPAQATPDHLEAFTGVYVFKEMNMGPMARRAVVAAVRGFYKWLEYKGRLTPNPSSKLPYPKAPQRLPLAMPLDAAERLMWAPDMSTFLGVRDAAMLGLLIGCGLRVSELVRLNTKDMLWGGEGLDEHLSLRVIGKGDKQRLVPVPDSSRLLIRAHMGHHYLKSVDRSLDVGNEVMFISTANRVIPPSELYGENLRISDNGVRKMIVKYGEQQGIPREYCHPHALRHLFGKELAEDDVDVLDRMALMGHADVKTAELYSHIVDRKLRKLTNQSSPMQKIKCSVTDISKYLQGQKK